MTETLPTTIPQWHEAIAAKAGKTPAEVAATFERLGIRGQPILPRARAVNVTAIEITGEKRGTEADGRFSFNWSDLGPGLWALLSEGNNKGKSSVLFIVRAALQGRFPGKLKRDVWSWIDYLRVGFTIDAVPYSLELRKDVGSIDEKASAVTLTRGGRGAEVDLYEGPAGDTLEDAMSSLFMTELGFETFHAYHAKTDTRVDHGWPSMSSAMFISGPSSAIFGEIAVDGLPLRLMQLFIGLPWISTYTTISSALKKDTTASAKRREAASAEEARVASRRSDLNGLLEIKKQELSKLPDRTALRADLDRLDAEAASAQAAVSARRSELEDLRQRAALSAAAHTEARRLHQQAKDEAAAGYVFRKLKPVCCPACESGFKPGRFEATETTTCGLCGSDDLPGDRDDMSDLSVTEAAVKDADTARKSTAAALTKGETVLSSAEGSRTALMKQLRDAERLLSSSDRSADLLLEIAVLEGRLEELGQPVEPAEAVADMSLESAEILKAAEKLTKAMMETLQAEVMKDIETETFAYAQMLGVQNLESFSFKAHAMTLRQGGVDNSFGGLNPYERLRMRVAASLATMKVARDRGYGRHPGLLVLDSPAAGEMSTPDFTRLISAVNDIVADIPGVQVIVGGVKRPELDGVVDFAHRREAVGIDTLF